MVLVEGKLCKNQYGDMPARNLIQPRLQKFMYESEGRNSNFYSTLLRSHLEYLKPLSHTENDSIKSMFLKNMEGYGNAQPAGSDLVDVT